MDQKQAYKKIIASLIEAKLDSEVLADACLAVLERMNAAMCVIFDRHYQSDNQRVEPSIVGNARINNLEGVPITYRSNLTPAELKEASLSLKRELVDKIGIDDAVAETVAKAFVENVPLNMEKASHEKHAEWVKETYGAKR